MSVFCLELGIVKADIRGTNNEVDHIRLVLWVHVIGLSNLNELRLEMTLG